MALIQNGTVVGDGSWILVVNVTDLRIQRSLRVKGDMHIGGLMLRLVEELDVTRDWSDHALWWPQRRRWLTHTRSTLDQVGVTAETTLEFTPMHKVARVQLPDLQIIDARLDFSVPVFNSVVQLCKEVGVRYPEELSLKRYISPEQLRKNLGFEQDVTSEKGQKKRQRPSGNSPYNQQLSQSAQNVSNSPQHFNQHDGSLPPSPANTPMGTLSLSSPLRQAPHQNGTTVRTPVMTSVSWGEGLVSEQFDPSLIHSPRHPAKGATMTLMRPKGYEEKAALNRGWLDSSRSLMEQGVNEGELVLLRFKFMAFYDLNPKYDPVRLNQMYEQARWTILMEELDTTEEESLMFSGLQLQVTLKAGSPENKDEDGDDVDLMLNDLEQCLEGIPTRRQDITTVPELSEYLKYMKPRKLTLKTWKRSFFTFRDLYLSWYTTASEAQGPPIGRFSLKGCEVTPEVNLAQNRFTIKLLVPSAEGMSEFWIRCDGEQQYARWMAGCKLAARGKTMADASYPGEVEQLRRLLQMQQPQLQSSHPHSSSSTQAPHDLNPDEFLPQRYIRRSKSRQHVVQSILQAHNQVKNLSETESKLQYVRAWQALPECGVHYFVVRMRGSRKTDLIGVAYNRIVKMNLDTGDSLKTWRFTTMKKWHVNWEIKHVLVQFEEEDVEFRCLSADCKVPHEFIGGYIFLSMRSKDQNQTLNEELFHKLTGGWA